MKQQPNPVKTMDSVDALDILEKTFKFFLRRQHLIDQWYLSQLREQMYRHRRALRPVIGDEEI